MNILITGGSGGLGKAILLLLAENAENFIYFTYASSSEASLKLESAYPNIQAIHCDFTDEHSIQELVSAIPGLRLHVLINNASTPIHKAHFNKIPVQNFLDNFKNNIFPVLRITQEVIKGFRKEKFGKIITILSSAIVNRPPIGWSDYVAGKAYLLAMSKSWATENISFNISSNCISPDFMLTSFNKDVDERIVEQMTEIHPLGKLLKTEEVAQAVLFFISSAQQINGVNLVINAGMQIN